MPISSTPPASKWFPAFRQELPKVDGKVFVITGTTTGTGFVAAQTIAELGGEVLLLNRTSERVTRAMEKLKEAVPNGKFVSIECDLQDFASVRKAASEIKSKYSKLYCLANNAGIAASVDKATKDGYDTQMQTNHLSHFLLTAELFPLLEAQAKETGDARIVNHSSMGRLHTEHKGLEEKYFGKNGGNLGGNSITLMGGGCFFRYFQSKLANSVFTYALHEKLKARGSKVRAVCAHPGGSDTHLDQNMVQLSCWEDMILKFVMKFLIQSPEDGTMGLLLCMASPDAQSGVLYGPKDSGIYGPAVPNPTEAYETDASAQEMLWRTSEEATGIKFTL
ncbi:unnamed protein product [Symbiodinium natans]|uniref:Protochlorophyllide reductase n=1 Tax=Symbiodinium natans TaxID=878477 RepID=A0A812G079_9DINO|nr:unnamed protein product [Symbiodinium natans]